jgi:gag-polyprotein putative aspartyl protease/Putative peptidoglycan binding domain
VPRAGGLTPQVWQARNCIKSAYDGQRVRWIARLSGPAFEEATRPAERHVLLQRGLGMLGFLPPAIRADGVYGAPTRYAIMAWQTGHGRTATGFLGEADAQAIEREALRGPEMAPVPPREPPGARDEIPLRPYGKLSVVPVRINDAITLQFILDSGASDVQIPADVAMTLARAGTIFESDILANQTCTLADGSEVKCEACMLRELRLGNHVVKNVTASIGSPKGELLLGQSFLSRFGAWTIDNARSVLVLHSPNGAAQSNLYGAQR